MHFRLKIFLIYDGFIRRQVKEHTIDIGERVEKKSKEDYSKKISEN